MFFLTLLLLFSFECIFHCLCTIVVNEFMFFTHQLIDCYICHENQFTFFYILFCWFCQFLISVKLMARAVLTISRNKFVSNTKTYRFVLRRKEPHLFWQNTKNQLCLHRVFVLFSAPRLISLFTFNKYMQMSKLFQ